MQPNGKSALTSMTSLQFAFSEVKSASRLQGIISFLSSDSMSYVETELWALGMGPLAKKNYLMPDEIRSLVRAVYSDSPARTQFLQKLSSPSLLFRI
ncbi:unnamed protein product [Protopolystoma xenopodis]|uniref:ZW10 C-terminal helical domain-containing protein n=1 Tax=Protopolystoma xenopodis TaxID=117903 RepID=A0A3S5FGQ9_9PLAT|nr:unnamed protein product [Protopolystoma xenopodis]